jgi:photosystem II stability/assembly factor-like uncharacterized protein
MKNIPIFSVAVITLAFAVNACKTVTTPPDNTTTTPGWSAGNFGTTETILGVNFPAPQIGYACGFNGTMLKTSDSGKTWSSLHAGAVGSENLYRISFQDVMTGVAGGNDGTIVRTTDGGATWSALSAPFNAGENIRDLVYSAHKIVVVGGMGAAEGFIMTSADDGQTWNRAKETSGTIYSVSLQSSLSFTAAGIAGQIFRTTDFGLTWLDESVTAAGDDFNALDFFDANHGTTVSYYGTIYASLDGGLIWTNQNSGLNKNPTNDGLLRTVKMLSLQEAWAAGESGTILHTTDGGSSWAQTSISGTSTISWNQIAARDAHTLAFVGDNGTLYWLTE